MLHVFIGKDSIEVRARAHAYIDREHAGVISSRITVEEYVPGSISERAASASLFGDFETILIDTLLEHEEAREECLSITSALAESPHTFVLVDAEVKAGDLALLKKYAASFVEIKSVGKDPEFNTFALADALVERNKKTLWVLLLRARHAGITAEEILGTLFWQIKMLRLAARSGSAKEAGMKDFVYNKARRGLRNFTPDELDVMSRTILALYHDGHAGRVDIDTALERFALRAVGRDSHFSREGVS